MDIDIFIIASLIGSVAFALSGYLIGVRNKLDFMGIFIVSILTANGGGALRDVLVNRVPAVLSDPFAFFLVCGVILIATFFKLHKRTNVENNTLMILCDAVGLVAFSITGTLIGLEVGLPVFGVMVLSFITATGGGIIRDMLVNQTPSVLSSDFYGTISLIIAASIYTLHSYNLADDCMIAITFSTALMLRILAYRMGWKLPHIRPDGE
ncbi:MAG: trimeric intracellular cation channel family protein [Alphaproteobacteria bacterium]